MDRYRSRQSLATNVRIGAVVTTRNKSSTFQAFLASLTNQSRPPDEVVLVDDASTDGTRDGLLAAPASWPRILHETRRGQSRARNAGLHVLGTELVICLDADIEMCPDMLEALESALHADPGASFAYCGHVRTGVMQGEIGAPPWDPDALRLSNFVSTMSLARACHLPAGAFDEALHRFEDWDLWLRMAQAGRRGVPVNRPLFTARYERGDVSTGEGKSAAEDRVRKMDRRRRSSSG